MKKTESLPSGLKSIQCQICGSIFWTDQPQIADWCPYGDRNGSHTLKEGDEE